MQAGASVGVGLFPDHGTTEEDLYRHVDQALYEAKRAGRGAWQWYGDGRLRIVTLSLPVMLNSRRRHSNAA